MSRQIEKAFARAEAAALPSQVVAQVLGFRSTRAFQVWRTGIPARLGGTARSTRWSVNSTLALGIVRAVDSRLRLSLPERVALFGSVREKVLRRALEACEGQTPAYLGLRFVPEGYELHFTTDTPPAIHVGPEPWFTIAIGPLLEDLKAAVLAEVDRERRQSTSTPPARRKRFPVDVDPSEAASA